MINTTDSLYSRTNLLIVGQYVTESIFKLKYFERTMFFLLKTDTEQHAATTVSPLAEYFLFIFSSNNCF